MPCFRYCTDMLIADGKIISVQEQSFSQNAMQIYVWEYLFAPQQVSGIRVNENSVVVFFVHLKKVMPSKREAGKPKYPLHTEIPTCPSILRAYWIWGTISVCLIVIPTTDWNANLSHGFFMLEIISFHTRRTSVESQSTTGLSLQ